MNEENAGGNPGGAPAMTPNPLSPANPGAGQDNNAPVEPVKDATSIPVTEAPVESAVEAPVEPAVEAPVEPAVEAPVNEPVAEVITETANPVSQPMVSTAEIEANEAIAKAEADKKKKSKTGLIIGIVAGLVVLVGGILGTMLALGMFNPADPVSTAVAKLFDEKPNNVKMAGTIKLVPSNNSFFTSATIDIDSAVKVGSLINATKATLSAKTAMGDIELSIQELYATNQEVYIKIDGISSASKILNSTTGSMTTMKKATAEDLEVKEIELDEDILEGTSLYSTDDSDDVVDCDSEDGTGCLDVTTGNTLGNYMLTYFLQMLGTIDGEWVRIPLDSLDSLGVSTNSTTQCMMDAYNSASKSENQISDIYKKNPFISSTTEGLKVTKKVNPIYKLVFDDEKLSSFASAIKSSDIFSGLKCLNTTSDSNVDLKTLIQKLPTVYVEVDGNHNFTRVYTNLSVEDMMDIEIDLSLSYPSTIDVAEPEEYIDLEEALNGQSEASTVEINKVSED